jgi:hypothetical protein
LLPDPRARLLSERVRRLRCRLEADHDLLLVGRRDREALIAER